MYEDTDSMTAMSHETEGFCFCGEIHIRPWTWGFIDKQWWPLFNDEPAMTWAVENMTRECEHA